MKHVRPRAAVADVLRARLLPAVLLGACAAAFGGLTALPSTAAQGPSVQAAAAPSELVSAQLERRRDVVRASRSRRAVEAELAARAAAEAAAAAAAQAAAAEAARLEAEARARAEAEARAAAEAAAAKAAAQRKARSADVPAGSFACPVPAASFTDTYGAARSGGRAHQGTDLLAPLGTPVYAVTSGRVRTASSRLGGISLYLDGDNGETYFYAHNSANVASTGQRVQAGELIARVGSTGNAGGTNHVHFERQVGGRSVNPYAFLRRIC